MEQFFKTLAAFFDRAEELSPLVVRFRQRKEECRALALFRLGPDSAPMAVDDPLADAQPDPGPGILLGVVRALECLEYPILVLHFEADAVVPNGKNPLPIL